MKKTSVREAAKQFVPPIALSLARWALGRRPTEPAMTYEGPFDTWETASAKAGGWDGAENLAKNLKAALRQKAGEIAFQQDALIMDHVVYSAPILALLLMASGAAGGGGPFGS